MHSVSNAPCAIQSYLICPGESLLCAVQVLFSSHHTKHDSPEGWVNMSAVLQTCKVFAYQLAATAGNMAAIDACNHAQPAPAMKWGYEIA